MDEFALIKKYFAPLAAGFGGSLALADDAALIDAPPGKQLIVTKDAISEGVHFLGNEDAALIARKLLRVNLSDLAAMGAEPLCYFLAVMLPPSTGEAWVRQFAQGLREDQEQYGIVLAGGDTTATRGALSLSLTALGTVEKNGALKRSGAKPGDAVYVSGPIGDAALGLRLLQGTLTAPPDVRAYLEQRYLLPEPQLALGKKLRGIASACIDVSDGLLQDLGHICAASHVGAEVCRHLIPLSQPAREWITTDAGLWSAVLGGGDDYQLLFTVPPEKEAQLQALSLPPARIGVVQDGQGVRLLDESGRVLPAVPGFTHFRD